MLDIKRRTWLVLGLLLVGTFVLVLWMHKEIILLDDGESRKIKTWAISVSQFLRDNQITLSEYDSISPPSGALLKEGSTIEIIRASLVQVVVDDKVYSSYAINPTPNQFLSDLRISLLPGDILLSKGHQIPTDEMIKPASQNQVWYLQRAVPIQLKTGSEVTILNTNATTVGQALWEAGIVLQSMDKLMPSAGSKVVANMEVSLTRARDITIYTQNGPVEILSPAETVAEALSDAGLSLQGLDYTLPSEKSQIPPDRSIRLVRVREEIEIEQTPIAFATSYQAVSDLELDKQTIIDPGTFGLEATRIRIRYEDDREASRQEEETWLALEPQTKVIGYGTKIIMKTVQTSDGRVEYWRALDVYATSYNPTSAGGEITSTGEKLKKGIIAVNPRYIPYGTRLYVPGYGFGTAADTGNLSARWIDLGYSDDDYVGWHHNIKIYFLWPPPDNIVWLIP